MRIKNKIKKNILIDVAPLSKSLREIHDYSGYQFLSPTALPLVKACEKIELSADELRLTFFLKENLRWNNGQKVFAQDYHRALVEYLKDSHLRFRGYLWSIEKALEFCNQKAKANEIGIETQSENCLKIQLRRPNRFLIDVLSMPNFSPLHKSDETLVCGPYYSDHKALKLKRNKYFSFQSNKNTSFQVVDEIQYHLPSLSDPYGIKSFENEELDLTCDTLFPFSKVSSLKSRNDFYKSFSGIMMVLVPVRGSDFFSKQFRQFLFQRINRDQISKALDSQLWPRKSCSEIFGLGPAPNMIRPANAPAPTSKAIRIGYEDFFPNRKVIEAIAAQLSTFGFAVELIQEEYGKRDQKVDYRLELRQCPFKSDYPLYFQAARSDCFSEDQSSWKAFASSLFEYQKSNTLSAAHSCVISAIRRRSSSSTISIVRL
ncbi:MAG: ABC transporter substrate-binding protein, partial [Bdellovibrionota bacterium]